MITLKRVEFTITYACSSNCRHCSLGDKLKKRGHLSVKSMKGVLNRLKEWDSLESVMCFGGEPLLYYKDVEGIMTEIASVSKKQIITNGYFTKNLSQLEDAILGLKRASVTNTLKSTSRMASS